MSLIAGCGGGSKGKQEAAAAPRLLAQSAAQAADTATIHGYRSNYTVVKNVDGSVTLTNLIDLSTQSFAPALVTITFADRVVSFDSAGIPGQSYRLYQAALNRTPDAPGLGYWTHVLQSGASLGTVAGYFNGSPEFQSTYGQVSDAQFVTLMYNNVLHRAPDQGGLDYWAQQMKGGLSRQDVLVYFSESKENKDNVAAAIRNGIDYVPDTAERKVIPVLKSSYENKIAAGDALGAQALPPEVAGGNAVAFADFFQDGSYAMVTHTLDYIPDWSQSKFGHIHFYQRDQAGQWIDNTSALLKDTSGCLHPRKAVVADFNGDGKPDVFFACHGYDRAPYPGEQPHVLLSQADGSYQNITLPVSCFCHAASAVDFSGNGYADIVVTDNMAHGTPFFLTNNRNGTFSVDTTRLPANLLYKAIFSVELIDFRGIGKYDVWVAGNEPGATANETTTAYDIAPTILQNDGNNRYLSGATTVLPINPDYGLALDIVFSNGKIYLLRTNIGGGPNNYGLSFYTTTAVQAIDYQSLASTMIYAHAGPYQNGMPWVNWIMRNGGNIVSMDRAYRIVLPQ